MKLNRIIFINSTVIYVIAFLLTTIIHEFGHALTGLYFGSQPVLHHNFVEHLNIGQLSTYQRVLIALSGPVVSLVQGLFSGLLYLKIKKQSLWKLFMLWFSVLGYSNFFGYLMTGPFFKDGDIGEIYSLTNTPLPIQIIIAITGAAVLFYIAFKLTTPFLQFSYKQEWLNDSKSRENFLFNIIILPWLAGSVIISLLYLPIVAVISIIYPFTSGMIFIFPWRNAKRIGNVKTASDDKIGNTSPILYLSMIVLIIVFRALSIQGVALSQI